MIKLSASQLVAEAVEGQTFDVYLEIGQEGHTAYRVCHEHFGPVMTVENT